MKARLNIYRKIILLSSVVIFASCRGYSQNNAFFYKPIPDQYLKTASDPALSQQLQKAKVQAFDATSILPEGYVTNGTVDYTAHLQAALNAHPVVLMPDFEVMVNDAGLNINSGQTLVFNTHSRLKLKPSKLDTYEILRIHNVSNITVYSPVIYGDKNTHLDSAGQWGMGIAVRASKNVTIVRPRVYQCWGDGIYIGQIKKQPAENVNIIDPLLDDNRRNGISITAVNGLNITGGVIANSNGQMPMSGIDIEPNHTWDVIDNITINKVVTFNHPKYGIAVSLQHLLNREEGTTSIKLINTIDEGSGSGTTIIGRPSEGTIKGSIEIIDPVWINNGEFALKLPLRTFGMQLLIKNPVLRNPNGGAELQKIKKYIQTQQGITLQ